MEHERKVLFAKNTLIMTSASMINKFIGLYLNILLARSLKSEGLGLYSLVMSVYILASGISVSGMSVAVTRITSQEIAKGNEETCRGALQKCMFISVILSISSGIVMACMSRAISLHWLKDIRTINSLCIISFALPFVSLSAMLRGWYTAKRRSIIPSLSQIFEQIIRLCCCLILVPKFAKNASDGCMAIVFSDVIAEFAGCMFIMLYYIASKKAKAKKPENIGRRVLDHALPITASHYLTSTLRSAESSLIPACLISYGMSREMALSQLGMIHSMVIPLLFFPSGILSSAGALLIPEVVRYRANGENKNVKATVEKAIKLTVCCAVPVSAVMVLFAGEWGMIIYKEEGIKMILTILAPLIPLMYCETICTAILRGLGEQISLLKYNIADGIIRIIFIFLLVPRFGVAGILAAMIISNLFTPIMCFCRLRKVSGTGNHIKTVFFSIAAAFGAGTAVILLKKALSEIPDKAGAVIFSIIFFFIYAFIILCSRQKLKEAVRRVCLQILKAVRCIFCRRAPLDVQAVRRVHHNR